MKFTLFFIDSIVSFSSFFNFYYYTQIMTKQDIISYPLWIKCFKNYYERSTLDPPQLLM